MAISRIGGTPVDNWELISSSTPTSGTTVSFTSISTSWRKLWVTVAGQPILLSVAGYLYTRVNSITTTNAYRWYKAESTTAGGFSDEANGIYSTTNITDTEVRINHYLTNPGNGLPFVTFEGQGAAGNTGSQIWWGNVLSRTTAITQIDIVASQTIDAANTGTVYLYGTR